MPMSLNDKKTILITGGAGFIGANFILYFLGRYDNYRIVNLDLLTYASDINNLRPVEKDPNYIFVKGDICDRALVQDLFEKYDIRGVIHFAAESHVDNSIENPGVFVKTNVLGTHVLLDSAYNYWMQCPGRYKAGYEGCRFHHISTDEVYGTLGDTGLFTEEMPYAPNSPYSASKAGSDMLARSYYHTYNMDVVITNCSNNYGPFQHTEKFIPTVIRTAIQMKPIPIYGKGLNTRDWLFVYDHCRAIDVVFHEANSGETFNIGGESERKNIEVAQEICSILDTIMDKPKGTYSRNITFVKDRPGHDWRYAMDISKIRSVLQWAPQVKFEEGLYETVKWFVEKFKKEGLI